MAEEEFLNATLNYIDGNVFLNIIGNMEARDILNLCKTSSRFGELCRRYHQEIWRRKIEIDFQMIHEGEEDTYEVYRDILDAVELSEENIRKGFIKTVKAQNYFGTAWYILDGRIENLKVGVVLSAKYGYSDILILLIKNGANVSKNNTTFPLFWASKNGHANTVKILLENDADPNGIRGRPLKEASKRGYYDVVKLLLEAGADPTLNGNEAIKIAYENGDYDMVELLENYVPDIE